MSYRVTVAVDRLEVRRAVARGADAEEKMAPEVTVRVTADTCLLALEKAQALLNTEMQVRRMLEERKKAEHDADPLGRDFDDEDEE